VDVTRQGSDVLLLATGPITALAEAAADALEADGVEATVAGVKRVHPLDRDALLPLLEGHQVLLTVEDNALAGGFGSAVLELMADAGLHKLCARAGLPDAFVPQGPVDVLRNDLGLTADGLVTMACRLLGRGDGAKD